MKVILVNCSLMFYIENCTTLLYVRCRMFHICMTLLDILVYFLRGT